jgi:hypothetical protein
MRARGSSAIKSTPIEQQNHKSQSIVFIKVSGTIEHKKRAGCVLEVGMVIAKLNVDDLSLVQQVKFYEEKFPNSQSSKLSGNKLHQVFNATKQSLAYIMDGYAYPDPYFDKKVDEYVTNLMNILRDPSLPLLELQEIISSKQGRIPTIVEKQINRSVKQYACNLTSILAQFPSQEIASIIDAYAASIENRSERDTFFNNAQGILQLLQFYRNGIKGHTKAVIQDLIKQYLSIESLFQHSNYDKSITKLGLSIFRILSDQ